MVHKLEGFSSPISNNNIAQVTGEATLAIAATETYLSPLGGVAPNFPSIAGELLSVVSESASDVGSMEIIGLGVDLKEQSEVVELAGTTPVNTTLSFTRINSLSWRESAKTVGNVFVRNLAGDTTYREYSEHTQGSPDMLYSVPAGKTAEAIQVYGAITRDSNQQTIGVVQLYFGISGTYFLRPFKFPVSTRGDSSSNYVNKLPETFSGPVDIYGTATISDADADMFCRLSLKVRP